MAAFGRVLFIVAASVFFCYLAAAFWPQVTTVAYQTATCGFTWVDAIFLAFIIIGFKVTE